MKWICHPYLMERANENKSEYVSDPIELENMFPGVDFSLYRELVERYVNGVEGLNGVERVPLFENKIDLLGRTDEFVRWVKEREERYYSCIVKLTYAVLDSYSCIIVSSHATWLHSLRNFSLSYEKEESREMFKKGQMLAVGLRFD
eukprot:scaffold57531_cov41-Cyclotella_meneghiniana.AAC.1